MQPTNLTDGNTMDFFWLKKAIYHSIIPLQLCLVLGAAGLFCLYFTMWQRAAKLLLTLSWAILALSTLSPLPGIALDLLESRAVEEVARRGELPDNLPYIVILGAGASPNPSHPASSQVSMPGVVRLVEGITFLRKYPGSKLVLTGKEEAWLMHGIALDLGVEAGRIIVDDQTMDTVSQAATVKEILQDQPFLLITSAWHMPRSLLLFRKQGLDPIPHITDHMKKFPVENNWRFSTIAFAEAAGTTERTMKEWLGYIWYSIKP